MRKHQVCKKKIYIRNPSTRTFENGNELGSIIGDSVITQDEFIEVTKTGLTKTIPKYCKKMSIFYSTFY